MITEEEKVDQGREKAEGEDLAISTLRKIHAALKHLQTKPLAFKVLQEKYISSETPLLWRPWHFSGSFWKRPDDIIALVYVIIPFEYTFK